MTESEKFWQCPKCNRYIPFYRQDCVCGYQFSGTELIVSASDISCDNNNKDLPFPKAVNTISGMPIQNHREYRQWQSQMNEKGDQATNWIYDAHKKGVHFNFLTSVELADEAISKCSFDIAGYLEPILESSFGKNGFMFSALYTIPALLCALAEKMLFQNDAMTSEIIRVHSCSDKEADDEVHLTSELMMWELHDALKIDLDIFRRNDNPFTIFLSILQEFVFDTIDGETGKKILQALRDFCYDYSKSLSYDAVTQYARDLPRKQCFTQDVSHNKYAIEATMPSNLPDELEELTAAYNNGFNDGQKQLFQTMGLVNPYTKMPITSRREYDEYLKTYNADKALAEARRKRKQAEGEK